MPYLYGSSGSCIHFQECGDPSHSIIPLSLSRSLPLKRGRRDVILVVLDYTRTFSEGGFHQRVRLDTKLHANKYDNIQGGTLTRTLSP